MRRLGGGIVCVLALMLLAVGAAVEGAPARIAGPVNFDLWTPVGLVCLICGVLILEVAPAAPRWIYLLAALVVTLAAGRNLYLYPPIADGAYFLLRYGRDAADRWGPAEPAAHMIPFAVAGWAAVRSAGAAGARLSRLAVFVVCTVAACVAYDFFMRGVISGSPLRLGAIIAGLALLAGGCAAWAGGNYDPARIGFGLTLTTILVSLASWGLYLLPLSSR